MQNVRQIWSWWRIALCALLCIGATLDDIDYINAIHSPRAMTGSRATSVADDDTDDQHSHFVLAPADQEFHLAAPFLSDIHTLETPKSQRQTFGGSPVLAGRAPPAFTA